jgi:uncharacterized protein (DUF1015 family)
VQGRSAYSREKNPCDRRSCELTELVDIRPFRAIQYSGRAGDARNLITLPYDKIDADMQRAYYDKSPYNFCRLILPMEENKYEMASQRIHEWISEGILVKDEEPAVFVSRQEFTLSGRILVRTGLITALRLYPYNENMVFPHEVTYSEPKTDRLNMLRAVQKNLEPVFLLYSDPDNRTIDFFAEITKAKPTVEIVDSYGVKHSIWRVSDPKELRFLAKEMEKKTLVITDGHHRYESAITYRDERRSQEGWTQDSAFNFQMCYMVPVQDEGLIILPAHRLLRKFKLSESTLLELKQFFTLTEIEATIEAAEAYLSTHADEHAFCIYEKSKAYGLLLKDEKTAIEVINAGCPREICLLDAVMLRDLIFKHVAKTREMKMEQDILYTGSTKTAFEEVNSGEAEAAFLLNPIDPKMVWQIAQKRWRLPEKSTDFYPKPVSGLIMMDIAPDEKLQSL